MLFILECGDEELSRRAVSPQNDAPMMSFLVYSGLEQESDTGKQRESKHLTVIGWGLDLIASTCI